MVLPTLTQMYAHKSCEQGADKINTLTHSPSVESGLSGVGRVLVQSSPLPFYGDSGQRRRVHWPKSGPDPWLPVRERRLTPWRRDATRRQQRQRGQRTTHDDGRRPRTHLTLRAPSFASGSIAATHFVIKLQLTQLVPTHAVTASFANPSEFGTRSATDAAAAVAATSTSTSSSSIVCFLAKSPRFVAD